MGNQAAHLWYRHHIHRGPAECVHPPPREGFRPHSSSSRWSRPARAQSSLPIGRIERLDPAFDALVPRDARIEKLAEGFQWSEGPVWRKSGGYLLFSDIPGNTINRGKEGEGIGIFLRPAGYGGPSPFGRELGSNGLTFDAKYRLVTAEHGNRPSSRGSSPFRTASPSRRMDAHSTSRSPTRRSHSGRQEADADPGEREGAGLLKVKATEVRSSITTRRSSHRRDARRDCASDGRCSPSAIAVEQ
jgi:hypothetical protein